MTRKRLLLQTALAVTAIALLAGFGPAISSSTASPAAVPAAAEPSGPEPGAPSLFEGALRWASATIFTLALLLGGAAWLRRRSGNPRESVLAIRHRIPLGRGTSIAIVEAGRGFVLIGVGSEGVSRLKEFDGDESEALRQSFASGARGAFSAILAGIASRHEERS